VLAGSFCLEVFVQYARDVVVHIERPGLAFRLLDFPAILVQPNPSASTVLSQRSIDQPALISFRVSFLL
jgi:hypothetical protein